MIRLKCSLKPKKERDSFELLNPKSQKFTKTDLAKYINASEMRPYDVSWGAEVNMTRFQTLMEKDWEKSNLEYNEEYYKDLIAKAIVFKEIERIISNTEWYQNNRGYRAQLVPYTFSKFVYEASRMNLLLNYKKIWEQQACLEEYKKDFENIAKMVYDVFNDTNRQILNIGEYAKREICWNKLNEKSYKLSCEAKKQLITQEDKEIDMKAARRDQKIANEVVSEIAIFKLGLDYWEKVKDIGEQLNELSFYEIQLCDVAKKYIRQEYQMLTKKQAKDLWSIKLKMDQYFEE